MLFNSTVYILLFLPVFAVAYNLIKSFSITCSKLMMIAASVYFYVYMTYDGAPVLAGSCIVTYACYRLIMSSCRRKLVLIVGVTANVGLLCIIKYNHFVPPGYAHATDWLRAYGMPLAVSFFTFQQISFLVDAYARRIAQVSALDYLYYVLFFPKLIAGPITRWQALMPQVNSHGIVKSSMVLTGLTVISIGLFKKVVLSGVFSQYADIGYANTGALNFIEAWVTSLSYTAQIYFDFSGYSDIAIGSALLIGIRLPDNFNSPYKAVNIRDFWNRWHISLSTWLRDYVYIPLGGSRKGLPRTLINLLITFLISGAWHGSELNFVIWGAMHGIATIINVLWERVGLSMPAIAGWLITFIFINFSWIPFRAHSVQSSYEIINAMFSPKYEGLLEWVNKGNYTANEWLTSSLSPVYISTHSIVFITLALMFIITLKNTSEIIQKNRVGIVRTICTASILSVSILFMFGGTSASQFIYSSF